VIVEARQAEISFGPDMPTKRRSNVPFWTKHGGDGTRLKRSESFLYVRRNTSVQRRSFGREPQKSLGGYRTSGLRAA
jgi:hypothetical protein